jgi:ABC-2 type transport system permease protein
MKALDFLLGYTAPMLIIVIAQVTITLAAACFFGLAATVNIVLAVLLTALTSLLFIGIGLLCGSLMSDKAVGGVCGALLTNVAGWLSGVFIPIDLIGGAFRTVTHILPFYHSIETVKMALTGDFMNIPPHLAVVLAYTFVVYLIAVLAFRQKMSGDSVNGI